MITVVALAALACVAFATAQQLPIGVVDSYSSSDAGHKLYRVTQPDDKRQRIILRDFLMENFDVMAANAEKVFVRVAPDQKFLATVEDLVGNATKVDVINSNLQEAVDAEMARLRSSVAAMSPDYSDSKSWFSEYHTYEDIKNWYSELASKHKDLITFYPTIGKSYEGRDIFALRVSSSKNIDTKPQFWFHSGDHAREWIGPAVVQYFVHDFVTGYGVDETATAILDSAEFIIVPLMNVDGYKYSWEKSRLWRKNRRPIKGDIFGSVGVDLNRNWDAHWGEQGSSSSPWSDIYHGPTAASEPEVQALVKFFKNDNFTRLIGAIDFHSFRPYGWTEDPAPDEKLLKTAGDGIRDVIKSVHGKKYVSEREIDLYAASGTASDWFYDAEVQEWLPDRRLYAYTIELRPAADEQWGGQGFILPPEQIVPTGEEISAAVKYFISFALKNPLLVKMK